MSIHNKLTIGLVGFGVVGEGIYRVLQQTPSIQATIKRVCIKHPDKKRAAPASLFTNDYTKLIDDPEINVIIELIDDAAEAFKIVTAAFRAKKSVVTANKKLVAEHLPQLLQLHQEAGVSFLYEGAVCGSIPIIRNLEEYYDNDLLQSICGIVNGSTNYILTKVAGGLTYKEALQEAQQLGFAESNPALDVEGTDAANKLTILLAHAYGIITSPDRLLYTGITGLQTTDAAYAEEKGYRVKLIAQSYKLANGKVAAYVWPQFVTAENQLYNVANEYNGLVVESGLADKQFLYGKGAGRYPTSSAVVSDISALRYAYKYEYRKLIQQKKARLAEDYFLKVYVSFSNWADVAKEDFEQITEFHSTADRQYLTGLIHVDKLRKAAWRRAPSVSIILLPKAIVERDAVVTQSVKKLSLQLAGVN